MVKSGFRRSGTWFHFVVRCLVIGLGSTHALSIHSSASAQAEDVKDFIVPDLAVSDDGRTIYLLAAGPSTLLPERATAGSVILHIDREKRTGQEISMERLDAGETVRAHAPVVLSADGLTAAFQVMHVVPSRPKEAVSRTHIILPDASRSSIVIRDRRECVDAVRSSSPCLTADGRHLACVVSQGNDCEATKCLVIVDLAAPIQDGWRRVLDCKGGGVHDASVSNDLQRIIMTTWPEQPAAGTLRTVILDRVGDDYSVSAKFPSAPTWRSDTFVKALSGNGKTLLVAVVEGTIRPGSSLRHHLYAWDADGRAPVLISHDEAGQPADDQCEASGNAISDDGSRILFQSEATNLVPAGVATKCNLYVRDRNTDRLLLVNAGESMEEMGNGFVAAAISRNGRFVVWTTWGRKSAMDMKPLNQRLFLRDLEEPEAREIGPLNQR